MNIDTRRSPHSGEPPGCAGDWGGVRGPGGAQHLRLQAGAYRRALRAYVFTHVSRGAGRTHHPRPRSMTPTTPLHLPIPQLLTGDAPGHRTALSKTEPAHRCAPRSHATHIPRLPSTLNATIIHIHPHIHTRTTKQTNNRRHGRRQPPPRLRGRVDGLARQEIEGCWKGRQAAPAPQAPLRHHEPGAGEFVNVYVRVGVVGVWEPM